MRALKNIAYFDKYHFSDNKKTFITGFQRSVISVFRFKTVFYLKLYASIFDLPELILDNVHLAYNFLYQFQYSF